MYTGAWGHPCGYGVHLKKRDQGRWEQALSRSKMKSPDCSHPKLVSAILMSVSGWWKSDFTGNSERLVLLLSASCAGRKEPGSGPQFERGSCAVAGGKGWLLGGAHCGGVLWILCLGSRTEWAVLPCSGSVLPKKKVSTNCCGCSGHSLLFSGESGSLGNLEPRTLKSGGNDSPGWSSMSPDIHPYIYPWGK